MNRAEKTSGRPTKLGVWRWLAIAGLVLLLAWVGVFAYVQWRPTPPLTAALLAPIAPQPGRNALASLWLLEREVPPGRVEEIAAMDWRDRERWQSSHRMPYWTPPSEEMFADQQLPSKADPPWCERDTPSCLGQVQANVAGYAQLVQAHAPVWRRVQALAQYELYQSPTQRGVDMPLAPLSPLTRMLTVHALRFAQAPVARKGEAVQALCQHLLTVRRLSEHDGTSLIFQMVGAAVVNQGLRLLVDMRLQAPGPLPAECDQALAPRADWPQATCQAMHGEALDHAVMFQDALGSKRVLSERVGSGWELAAQALRWLGMGTPELNATHYANHLALQCEPSFMATVQAGQRPEDESGELSWSSLLFMVRAPGGSLLQDIATPAMNHYTRRLADREAMRMAGRSWLWLQGEAQRQPALAQALARGDVVALSAALAKRPAADQMPGRNLNVVSGAGGKPTLRLVLWQPVPTTSTPHMDLPLR